MHPTVFLTIHFGRFDQIVPNTKHSCKENNSFHNNIGIQMLFLRNNIVVFSSIASYMVLFATYIEHPVF